MGRGVSPMHVSEIEGRKGGGCLFISGVLTFCIEAGVLIVVKKKSEV